MKKNIKKPLVAIIGRPNVGKSSIFNRILGQRKSIVCDESGTTRDRVVGEAEWQGKYFFLVDTAGLFGELEIKDMAEAIDRQIDMAVDGADILLLVFDGKAPLNQTDYKILRKVKRHVDKLIVVVNKMDSSRSQMNWESFNKLSGVEKVGVSARTGRGIGDLLELLTQRWSAGGWKQEEQEGAYYVSVIGRPNVGKSSLINQIAGFERMVVSQTPGTTRDIGEIKINYGGQSIIFFDTAGVRSRRVLAKDEIEKYSYIRALRAMEMSTVVVLMVDAVAGVGKTEVKLVNMVEELGKGLVVFVNKLDLVGTGEEAVAEVMKKIRKDLIWLDWTPVVVGSALERVNINVLLKNIEKVGENCRAEIRPEILRDLVQQIKLNYRVSGIDLQRIKQIGINPPKFLVGNTKKNPSCQTERMLVGIIRDALGLSGVPVKIKFK